MERKIILSGIIYHIFLIVTFAQDPGGNEKKSITVNAVGDIMPGTNYPNESYLPPDNNCYPLLQELKPYLLDATLTLGNLEGVFCGVPGKPKECRDTSKCYVFRMPDSYLDCIIDAGFDGLSLANNHINDFGPEGRSYTVHLLEEKGMAQSGLTNHPYTIIEKEGYRIGFIAFSPHSGSLDLEDYSGAKKWVGMLNDSCDIVIVFFHGGAEGKDYQRVPKSDESFLGEYRGNIYRFAHEVIDSGADLVLGSGPHVTRAIELYKDRLICYSLGNFCTWARFNLTGPNGISPLIKTWLAPDGSFLTAKIIPVCQVGEGGAKIDSQGRAIKIIKELTRLDFPETPLVIEEDGTIHRKDM
jgi:hypothetical protein